MRARALDRTHRANDAGARALDRTHTADDAGARALSCPRTIAATPHGRGGKKDKNCVRDRARNRPLARTVYVAKTLPGPMGKSRRRTDVFETTVRVAAVKTYIVRRRPPDERRRENDDGILLR